MQPAMRIKITAEQIAMICDALESVYDPIGEYEKLSKHLHSKVRSKSCKAKDHIACPAYSMNMECWCPCHKGKS